MPDLAGTVLDGKYELIRLLGEGGMGAVYEARHRLIGRRLAVKFLHPHYVTSEEVVTRFQREAQAAAAIGHEHIIDVTDMGQTPEGAPYLVMEYLDGLDVRDLLAQAGSLSIEQASHIMVQALSALQSAHDAGIIHRDLKPENIYLIEKPDRKDYVKLLDFGISKFKAFETDGMKGLTQTGTVLGTPYYMSPEQARGDQNIGTRSDIYAMGVILFQMLTGKLPFDAPNYNALLIKILTEDPPDPLTIRPELPLDIVETIKIAMSREANDRFADCVEFKNRLIHYVPNSNAEYKTGISSASRSAIRVAMSATSTPLDMSRSGGIEPQKSRMPLVIGVSIVTLLLGMAVLYLLIFPPSGSTKSDTVVASADNQKPLPSNTLPQFQSQQPSVNTSDSTPASTQTDQASAEQESKVVAVENKPEMIEIKINAEPSNSRITLDGVLLIGNPHKLTVAKDEEVHKVEIFANGFEPVSAEVQFSQNQEFSYTLSKIEKVKTSRKRNSKKPPNDNVKNDVLTDATKTSKKGGTSATNRRRIDDDDPWK